MSNVLLIGSTGLVGKEILKQLNNDPHGYAQVLALTRRSIPGVTPASHVHEIIEKDSANWTNKILETNPHVHALVSALGTTRAQAGGLENQYKIDHDLNYEVAKFAKEKLNCDTYVLISTTAASSGSRFPYFKMKGELEDHVKELKFNKTIILQPGLLLGEREKDKTKGIAAEAFASVSSFVKNRFGTRVMDCVTGEEVAAVAAKLLKDSTGFENGSVTTVGPKEIIKIANGLKA